jgi:hypothetical protein
LLDRQHPREHLAGRAGIVDDEDTGVAVVQRPLDRADDIGKGELVVLQDVVDDLPLHDPAARGKIEGGGEDDRGDAVRHGPVERSPRASGRLRSTTAIA